MFRWFRKLFSFDSEPSIIFDYKDFGGLTDYKRKCTRCNQWFIRNSDNSNRFIFIPVNGIILDKNCPCHKRGR